MPNQLHQTVPSQAIATVFPYADQAREWDVLPRFVAEDRTRHLRLSLTRVPTLEYLIVMSEIVVTL